MVHTFQCLGVRIAVDVNSGAVHVLDELTYDLLSALAEREENGESCRPSWLPRCPSMTPPPWPRPGGSCRA